MHHFANPVRTLKFSRNSVYPYYAGFSDGFAIDAINWVSHEKENPLIIDPWNGAGTTTRIGHDSQVRTLGFDLNPVMVLVANAELVSSTEITILRPLSRKITEYARLLTPSPKACGLDALVTKSTATHIRNLAMAIWLHLVDEQPPHICLKDVNDIAPTPSLLLVALFNVLRELLKPLATSNPTWLKIPASPQGKEKCSQEYLHTAFIAESQRLSELLSTRIRHSSVQQYAAARTADSRKLPLESHSVDGIVTSPPYCTRLDYGRATIAELLALESIGLANYEAVRSILIGAAITQKSDLSEPDIRWGPTCLKLLMDIHMHPSHASQGYYYRSHRAYFESIFQSIAEISRVLKGGSRACIVVQDSYYKDLHTDLPAIVNEMADAVELVGVGNVSFEKQRSLCTINPGSRQYRAKRKPIETAILLKKR